MNLSFASAMARRIAEELTPFCSRLEIAGSIRRQRPEVGDIDIVCIPRGVTGREGILQRCARGPTASKVKEGEQYVVFEYRNPQGTVIQLDLWFAHDGMTKQDMFASAPDPSNFGVLLLARTGSAMHNVWIAQTAKAKGLHFHPHQGVTRQRQVIASAEEADVFRALGLDWIAPERRER